MTESSRREGSLNEMGVGYIVSKTNTDLVM